MKILHSSTVHLFQGAIFVWVMLYNGLSIQTLPCLIGWILSSVMFHCCRDIENATWTTPKSD